MKRSDIKAGEAYAVWRGNEDLPRWGSAIKITVVDLNHEEPHKYSWQAPIKTILATIESGEKRHFQAREIKCSWTEYTERKAQHDRALAASARARAEYLARRAPVHTAVVEKLREKLGPEFGFSYDQDTLVSFAAGEKDEIKISATDLAKLLGVKEPNDYS